MTIDLHPGAHVHIIGIGGAGMSAIAIVLLERGYNVSGSDQTESATTQALRERGASVNIGHMAENVKHAQHLVISSAIKDDNVEYVAAQQQGIAISKRAQFLGWMMQDNIGIAVAGTHGKTTTTAMIASILKSATRDPSFIVGGIINAPGLDTSAHAGHGAEFVIEADEYDNMFLGLSPHVAIVTNVEHDHPDCFPTFDLMLDAFREFAGRVSENGLLIVGDDKHARTLRTHSHSASVTYGFGDAATWRATNVQPNNNAGSDFLILRDDKSHGLMRLRIPGNHNVLNALAAVVATDFLGIPFDDACRALMAFRGVQRRFEIRGEVAGVTVVDDYAHHPTAIRATLAAARMLYPKRVIWAVWQPHTFSRTKLLADEFTTAFDDADHVIVTKIYASREQDSMGIDAREIVERMQYGDARYAASLDEALLILTESVRADDVVITLSAGDAIQISQQLLERLATD